MLAELDGLAPEPGEEERLAAERGGLQAHEKIVAALAETDAALNDQGGVEKRVRAALRAVERVAERAGGRLDAVRDALDRCLTDLADATALLERTGRTLDADPRALEKIEERLFALRAAARKHGVAVDGLPAMRERFRRRLAVIEDDGAALVRLTQAAAAARQVYERAAARLSQARAKAAAKLDRAVAKELEPLKLGAARFATAIEIVDPAQGGADGVDKVGFTVATNAGTAPGPLAKIASGGELSRLMLALKAVLAGQGSATSLVFDEVDRGVGGATAAAVGERLARLAAGVQVLVVTHSPQVAALGDQHFRIAKHSPSRQVTLTRVTALPDERERVEEIARMLAGAEVTEAARAAAQALRAGGAS
jgi:DNA repair protein RecN (Recombination protein N)